jgi:hypothetical protein
MRYMPAVQILCCASILVSPVAAAEPPGEDLADKVRVSIDQGVKFLRDYEAGRGHWGDIHEIAAHPYPGGWTGLAMLALLYSGVPPEEAIIQRGLKSLRKVTPAQTYVVSLQTLVFALAAQNEDRERLQRNVDWLLNDARVMNGGQLLGWGYKTRIANQVDNSNTQYALLALHEAHVAGARIAPEVWQSIRSFYVNTQQGDGNWGYPHGASGRWMLTMTTAGLCGLLISGMDLNVTREKPLGNGIFENCGIYDAETNRGVRKALDWIGDHFPSGNEITKIDNVYYWLYGIERAGRLTGQRFFVGPKTGAHDWYRAGCEFLVEEQKKRQDGSWAGRGLDGQPVIATSFALLFLSKGRTPILISKLAHTNDDWNNDRNDARNLVAYAQQELFKKQQLGWQVFDVRRSNQSKAELLADLSQSPIVYFNGHQRPSFTGVEVDGEAPLLRQYVENGGFILAEACCGDARFRDGFEKLMAKLFPDNKLKKLDADHPIWRASGKLAVPPKGVTQFPLYGIEMGCKVVVVYSPNDLSCWWESNKLDDERAQWAFRVGANIIAYATGLEAPKPRQFKPKVEDEADPAVVPRGYLKVGQLRHEGDWQPAPNAMRNLMISLEKLGLDVDRRTEGIKPTAKSLDYRFLYLHGRNAFSFEESELKNLRFNLETGGLLFADACCGSKMFDESFRSTVRRLWPGRKLEPIPLTDDLYGKELNGTAITKVRCRREAGDGQPETSFREMEPFLEGIKMNGRWVVIYSKYDIGCALENHKASDCLGHDHESALRLGKAVVLYALKR